MTATLTPTSSSFATTGGATERTSEDVVRYLASRGLVPVGTPDPKSNSHQVQPPREPDADYGSTLLSSQSSEDDEENHLYADA